MDEPVKSPALGIPVAIVIGSIIIGGALYMSRGEPASVAQISSSQSPLSSPAGEVAGEQNRLEVQIDADDAMLGNPQALTTIIEFSDFVCSYCATWQQSVGGQLIKNYVDTGKAKLVFKHFPLSQIHAQATAAAQAAVCAQAQQKFWPYADLLFSRQPALAEQDLVTHAQEVGLNLDQFKTCLADPKTQAAVFADTQAGITVGITGTPTLVINGQLVDASTPYEEITKVIDAATGSSFSAL